MYFTELSFTDTTGNCCHVIVTLRYFILHSPLIYDKVMLLCWYVMLLCNGKLRYVMLRYPSVI